MTQHRLFILFSLIISLFLTACGFHLQGQTRLAAPLHNMYLQTPDPYGQLGQSLKQYLNLSKVHLTNSAQQAQTILVILDDSTSQELLSVSGTQQTRQYLLKVTVTFEVTDNKGKTLIGPQTLIESRTTTIQSNQILGSSNETNLFYQQMRRTLAYSILNIIASKNSTRILEKIPTENPS